MRNQIKDNTNHPKRDPTLIQTVTLTNTNRRNDASGLVLEVLGYDDLELISFKVTSSGWAKNTLELTDYGNLVVSDKFIIPAGKSVAIKIIYKVRNCPTSTNFNFYAQLMIPDGGEACYKYTSMPVSCLNLYVFYFLGG